jgi:hypothetical protein
MKVVKKMNIGSFSWVVSSTKFLDVCFFLLSGPSRFRMLLHGSWLTTVGRLVALVIPAVVSLSQYPFDRDKHMFLYNQNISATPARAALFTFDPCVI